MNTKQPFKWKHFQGEIILLGVRWYLKYALSYRNLEEIMTDHPGVLETLPFEGKS